MSDLDETLSTLHELARVRIGVKAGDLQAQLASDDEAVLSWSRRYLVPAFDLSATAGRGGWSVAVSVDPTLMQQVQSAVNRLPAVPSTTYEDEPALMTSPRDGLRILRYQARAGITVIDSDRLRVSFLSDSIEEASFEAARLIREVIRRLGEARGEVVVHAGAVLVGGKAWIVCGPKAAGKTTTVCALLEQVGASFVANDRVHLSRAGKDFTVRAWPMSTRIGLGTCQSSPSLRHLVRPGTTFAYPQTGWDPEVGISDDEVNRHVAAGTGPKVELVTDELVAALGCTAAMGGPVAGVILPTRSDAPVSASRRPADPSEAAAVVRGQLFIPTDDAYPDWLGLRRTHDEQLESDARRFVADLIAAVPTVDISFFEGRQLVGLLGAASPPWSPVSTASRPLSGSTTPGHR